MKFYNLYLENSLIYSFSARNDREAINKVVEIAAAQDSKVKIFNELIYNKDKTINYIRNIIQ